MHLAVWAEVGACYYCSALSKYGGSASKAAALHQGQESHGLKITAAVLAFSSKEGEEAPSFILSQELYGSDEGGGNKRSRL